MPKNQNNDVIKWQCYKCGRWNNVEDAFCIRCASPSSTAFCYLVHQPLTQEEKDFFTNVAPRIVELLEQVLTELRRLK